MQIASDTPQLNTLTITSRMDLNWITQTKANDTTAPVYTLIIYWTNRNSSTHTLMEAFNQSSDNQSLRINPIVLEFFI